MRIRVKLFALMAERAGVREAAVEVGEGATVGEAVGELQKRYPGIPWVKGTMLAVNQDFVKEGEVLQEGDELAIIPPVSGG